jgi:penicillin amidase
LQAPALWYLAHVATPEATSSAGRSPAPFIVLGRNDHLAWAFTTTNSDTQDLFIESSSAATATSRPRETREVRLREERST